MLEGGLEIGASLRPEGGGGSTDGRPEGGGGGTVGLLGNRPADRIETAPETRLEGGADGGGSVGRLEAGTVSRLEGGLESGEMSLPSGPWVLSFELISGSSPDH
jgi:hypothetical protein